MKRLQIDKPTDGRAYRQTSLLIGVKQYTLSASKGGIKMHV